MSDFEPSVQNANVKLFLTGLGGTPMIGELETATLEDCSRILNDVGSCSFSMHPEAEYCEAIELFPKTEVQVWIDETLRMVATPMSCAGDQDLLTFTCPEILIYFMYRIVEDQTLEYTSLDLYTIFSNYVAYAQDGDNKDFNVGVSLGGGSGRVVSDRRIRSDHEIMLDILKDLTTINDGMDFGMSYAPGQRLLVPYHPKKGAVLNAPVLDNNNIVAFEYNEDASPLRTKVFSTGGTVPNSEEGRMEAVYEDEAKSTEYGFVAVGAISDGAQMDVDWLLDKATAEVNLRKNPLIIPSVTVKNDPVQVYGVVGPGDWVPVRLNKGRAKVTGSFRIYQDTWNPDNTVTFQFGEVA